MSRTELDATTLANSLRMMAGDGSIEWVSEPIQASVLLDIADMLDENAKLRELVKEALMANKGGTFWEYFDPYSFWASWRKDASELGIEVSE